MTTTRAWLAAVLLAMLGAAAPTWAQTPAPEAKTAEEKPKSMDTFSFSLYYSFF